MGVQPSPMPKSIEWKIDDEVDTAYLMVTGSREFTDLKAVDDTLRAYYTAFEAKHPGKTLMLISGHAQRGADVLAEMVWSEFGPVYTEPAQWDVHTPDRCKCANDESAEYCRLAGIVRNEKMVNDWPLSVVIAFYNPTAANAGTNHAAEYARNEGIPVRTVIQHIAEPQSAAVVASEPAASDSTPGDVSGFLAASVN